MCFVACKVYILGDVEYLLNVHPVYMTLLKTGKTNLEPQTFVSFQFYLGQQENKSNTSLCWFVLFYIYIQCIKRYLNINLCKRMRRLFHALTSGHSEPLLINCISVKD